MSFISNIPSETSRTDTARFADVRDDTIGVFSSNVFHSPHDGHLPFHFPDSYPHCEHTYTVFALAILFLFSK